MEFTVALFTANLGAAVRRSVNPFTKEPVEFPIDDGLTEPERAAVRSILSLHGASEPDPDGFRYVRLADGTKANVGASHLDREGTCPGISIELNAASSCAAAFVFELASKGNMYVGSSCYPAVNAAVSAEQAQRIRARYPSVPVLQSATELLAWVEQRLAAGDIV